MADVGKMYRKGAILIALWVAAALGLRAQAVVPDRIIPDTVTYQHHFDESNRFYRRLYQRSEDSRLARRLYRALVSAEERHHAPESPETALEKEVGYFRNFEGRTIRSIHVNRSNVFRSDYPASDFRTLANGLHAVTAERKIRRNIFFKVGETVSPMTFASNEQFLRSRSYLSDAYILLEESADGDGVDVYIVTRDSWSIGLTIGSVPGGDGRRYLDLYDDNIFGSGDRLDLRTYFNYKGGKVYGGNMLEYHASNLWGSFFQLDMIAGWGYDERRFGIRMDKEYLQPTDFIAGGAIEDIRHYEQMMLQDTVRVNRYRNFDGWAGKSWEVPSLHSSFYIGGRYQHLTFLDRPSVAPDSNSYYHSRQTLLFNTGIYRETYYQGNMIYGYGRTENIPYGHRFEVTAGRCWGEFRDKWYTDFTAQIGMQTRSGYFRTQGTVGTFWDGKLKPTQSVLELKLDYFSNLMKIRRSYLRQFMNVRYLQGYNRLSGEGEEVTFWQDAKPRGLRNDWVSGNTRLVGRNETVVFSPIYFYGFRFAFFGFADVGWIGDRSVPFENDFYSAIGLGVRLKNERLIFGTIQLQFGFALNGSGFMDYRHVRFSSEQAFRAPRFKAVRPEFFEFR